MSEYLSPNERETLLKAGVINGSFILASGQHATQKFEFDNIARNPRLLKIALNGLKSAMKGFEEVRAVITVANGATCLGDELARAIGIEHVKTEYKLNFNGVKTFSLHSEIDISGKSTIIIDDVFTRGTNMAKVLRCISLAGGHAVGGLVVLNRSGLDRPQLDGIPIDYLIKKELL